MSKTEIQAAIDQHSHRVGQIQYRFRLQSAALEPRWSSRSARYLLAIEVRSDSDSSSRTMHVLTRAGTSGADLLRLVDDALEDLLENEGASSAGGSAFVSPAREPHSAHRPSRDALDGHEHRR